MKEVISMKITQNLGMLVLAIFLIVWGVLNLGVLSISGATVILAIVAIAAGVLILIGK